MEAEAFKKESRETNGLLMLELENTKNKLEHLENESNNEIGKLRSTIIELESTCNDATRDIDSFKQQIENMSKSKLYLEIQIRMIIFRCGEGTRNIQ